MGGWIDGVGWRKLMIVVYKNSHEREYPTQG